jgi:hypothetical protein
VVSPKFIVPTRVDPLAARMVRAKMIRTADSRTLLVFISILLSQIIEAVAEFQLRLTASQ